MKCQSCKTKTARVHLTEIGSKMKKEIHLCEECARNHDAILTHTVGQQPKAAGESILDPTQTRIDDPEPGGVCRSCGMSFAEFRSTGRLGCPEDYEVFRRGLLPVIERIHGGGRRHRGKVPPQLGKRAVLEHEIVKLNDRLQRAVRAEKYEEAARLRDRIQSLREEVGAD